MNGRPWWQILLAIWFVLWGLLEVTSFHFQFEGFVLGVLAIAVGVLWFVNK